MVSVREGKKEGNLACAPPVCLCSLSEFTVRRRGGEMPVRFGQSSLYRVARGRGLSFVDNKIGNSSVPTGQHDSYSNSPPAGRIFQYIVNKR